MADVLGQKILAQLARDRLIERQAAAVEPTDDPPDGLLRGVEQLQRPALAGDAHRAGSPPRSKPPTAWRIAAHAAAQICSMSCSTPPSGVVNRSTGAEPVPTMRPSSSTTTALTFVVPRSNPRYMAYTSQ